MAELTIPATWGLPALGPEQESPVIPALEATKVRLATVAARYNRNLVLMRAEVAGLTDSQLDQERPVLHHHPALPVLGKGLALLQGPGLLQQTLLRVQLHRSSRTRFCRHAPGPQRAYPAYRRVESEGL